MGFHSTKKMKFSVKDFFSKCDQIRRKLRIWSHLLKNSLMENFIFCAKFAIAFFQNWSSVSTTLSFSQQSDVQTCMLLSAGMLCASARFKVLSGSEAF